MDASSVCNTCSKSAHERLPQAVYKRKQPIQRGVSDNISGTPTVFDIPPNSLVTDIVFSMSPVDRPGDGDVMRT